MMMVHGTGGCNAGQGTLPVMIPGSGETGYACAGLSGWSFQPEAKVSGG